MLIWQPPVPVQVALPVPPLQPANSEPPVGAAARLTNVPKEKLALQFAPHAILGEAGNAELTVPVPVPARMTVSMAALLVALVVELKVPLTPPMKSVVMTAVLGNVALVWRTHTVCI